MMERRKFPRLDVRNLPLKATLVLQGSSLLQKNSRNSVEIETRPINLSQGGVCLSMDFNVDWETLTLRKEVEVLLENGPERQPLFGKVVRLERGENHILSLEFASPLRNVTHFLIPEELRPS